MKKVILLVALSAVTVLVSASTNINSTNKASWGANIGWINWRGDVAHGAVIGDYVLGGFIYGANVGWINLGDYNPVNHIHYQNNSKTDFGVNLTKLNVNTASLRGYAWGANIGWVNFEDKGNPTVDLKTRHLHGYAWGANVGWINLGELGVTLAADSIAPGVDADGNGIPDAYEEMHFGTVGVDPAGDPDADGLPNLQEYKDGTDPNFPDERLLNISTRLAVQTGDNVLIGGFIITGKTSKRIIVRGLGPSLASQNVQGALDDPTLELHSGSTVVAADNNWKDSQEAEVRGTGIPPSDNRESAIVRTLNPGKYTAVLAGNGGTTGVGLVEAYDLDQSVPSRLANISTRGVVGTQASVLIGGFIIGPDAGGTPHVILRAIGPSLTDQHVQGALQDPILELHDEQGHTLATNDNWQQSQKAEIEATGIPPSDPRESAIVARLKPGKYTGVVRGKNDTTGVALVEVYNIP